MRALYRAICALILAALAVPVVAGAPAGSASVDLTWHDRLAKLQRASQAAAASNPETADPSAQCTLTTSSTADSALNSGRLYSGSTLSSYIKTTGGAQTYLGGGYIFPVATEAPLGSAGNIGYLYQAGTAGKLYNGWGWTVAFQTDTALRSMIHIASASTTAQFRVMVDGRYVPNPNSGSAPKDPIPYVVDASGNSYIVVDCGTQVLPHTISFEGAEGEVLLSINVLTTASIAKPNPQPDQILVLSTGDSYSEGQGTTWPGIVAWPRTLGKLMGWSDVRQVAVGTTGTVSTGNFGTNIRSQIPNWFGINGDITGAQVDIITHAPGYNDAVLLRAGTLTQAALQAEYLADLQLERAACPNALIIVFGSGAGKWGPDTYVLQAEASALAAYNAWPDTHKMFVPMSSATPAWLFGTGRVGATTGNGNADVLVSTDGVHPDEAGHRWFAARAAAAIRAGLPSLPPQ